MKSMTVEISEYEKNLNANLRFDVLLGYLSARMSSYCDAENESKYLIERDAWVCDFPTNALDPDVLPNLYVEYFLNAQKSTPSELDHSYFHQAARVYEAAARRARTRNDDSASWALLNEAQKCLHSFELVEVKLRGRGKQVEKSVRAAANGGIPGQRVRYMIVALMHQEQSKSRPLGFENVDEAVGLIDKEIRKYLKRTGLTISADDLAFTVKNWIKEHPAFRAELEPLFAEGEITD